MIYLASVLIVWVVVGFLWLRLLCSGFYGWWWWFIVIVGSVYWFAWLVLLLIATHNR